jgi:hypothetical protein
MGEGDSGTGDSGTGDSDAEGSGEGDSGTGDSGTGEGSIDVATLGSTLGSTLGAIGGSGDGSGGGAKPISPESLWLTGADTAAGAAAIALELGDFFVLPVLALGSATKSIGLISRDSFCIEARLTIGSKITTAKR